MDWEGRADLNSSSIDWCGAGFYGLFAGVVVSIVMNAAGYYDLRALSSLLRAYAETSPVED